MLAVEQHEAILRAVDAQESPAWHTRRGPMVPGTRVQLLSITSSMRAWSFSLPALHSCPGAVVRPARDGRGAVCGACYARQGRYTMSAVIRAQWARFVWTRACMQTDAGRAYWARVMVAAIMWATWREHRYHVDAPATRLASGRAKLALTTRAGLFRGHDSGDLFAPAYVDMWREVTAALPGVRFWLPTRAWRLALTPGCAGERWRASLAALAALPNVTLRPSALHIGDAPPQLDWLAAGTSVGAGRPRKGIECPKVARGWGNCRECTACYTAAVPVDYPLHGRALGE